MKMSNLCVFKVLQYLSLHVSQTDSACTNVGSDLHKANYSKILLLSSLYLDVLIYLIMRDMYIIVTAKIRKGACLFCCGTRSNFMYYYCCCWFYLYYNQMCFDWLKLKQNHVIGDWSCGLTVNAGRKCQKMFRFFVVLLIMFLLFILLFLFYTFLPVLTIFYYWLIHKNVWYPLWSRGWIDEYLLWGAWCHSHLQLPWRQGVCTSFLLHISFSYLPSWDHGYPEQHLRI